MCPEVATLVMLVVVVGVIAVFVYVFLEGCHFCLYILHFCVKWATVLLRFSNALQSAKVAVARITNALAVF